MDENWRKRRAIISQIYKNAGSPGGFSGVENLYRESKKVNPAITRANVKKFLEGSVTYTLNKPRRVNFPRLKTIPTGFMTDVQVDLADFQKLFRKNKGYRYMLVGIDVLSKRVFTTPTKSKGTKDMINAFEQLFAQMPRLPHQIYSDRGLEFVSTSMREYFKSKGKVFGHLTQLSRLGLLKDVLDILSNDFIDTLERAKRSTGCQLFQK
jgi:hypothetical protein